MAVTGLVKAWTAIGASRALDVADPIVGIPFRQLFLLVGLLELFIAFFCLFTDRRRFSLLAVAWLATNFVVYRLGLWWMGWHRPCGCLGNLTDLLGISPQMADTIMKVVLVYLLVGSYGLLVWQGLRGVKDRRRLRCNIVNNVTAAYLFASIAITAVAQPGNPDPLDMLFSPPQVERLLARKTFEDGTRTFVLLRTDGSNFFVETSRTKDGLDQLFLNAGDDVAARMYNIVWMHHHGLGKDVWVTYANAPATTNQAIQQHHHVTMLVADHISRLGRSILSYGIEFSPFTDILKRDGVVHFRDGDYQVRATVTIKQPQSDVGTGFVARMEKLKEMGRSLPSAWYSNHAGSCCPVRPYQPGMNCLS